MILRDEFSVFPCMNCQPFNCIIKTRIYLLNRVMYHSISSDDGSGSQSNFPRLSSRCSPLRYSFSSSGSPRTTENTTARYTRPVEMSLSVYRSSWLLSSTYFMICRLNPGRRTEKSIMIGELTTPIRATLRFTDPQMPNRDSQSQQHTSSQAQTRTPFCSPRPGNAFCGPWLFRGY